MSTAELPAPAGKRRRRIGWVPGALLLLTLGVAALSYAALSGSLPQLDGSARVDALRGEVVVSRDAAGVATISASSRRDAAAALGFVHGQERFFQMDLLRRFAAGELSELFGAAALEVDREQRRHRFRARAGAVLKTLPDDDRVLLDAYSAGVNAGLSGLRVRPFEYLLLRAKPRYWSAEDSLLVVYAMYFRLQRETLRQERLHHAMYRLLPASLYRFLTPRGGRYQAGLDGVVIDLPPLPAAAEVDLRSVALPQDPPPAGQFDEADTGGSNAWAVVGSRGALLANDMHLNLQLPNIWYRAELRFVDRRGARWQLDGVTLPGVPAVVAGSNGRIAWGFTNSYGDWSDLVRVEPAGEASYRTPDGTMVYTDTIETITVRDAEPVRFAVRETVWGPLLGTDPDSDGERLALRWVAHYPRAVNLALLRLETASTVAEALGVAQRAGIPAQNILIADRDGHIGWTLCGPIPRRRGAYGERPRPGADPDYGWYGWLDPADYPRRQDPPGARLWSANARMLAGAELALIGDGGYALGARARQIRDRLRQLDDERVDEVALLKLQLDDRALWLQPWRRQLERQLQRLPPEPKRQQLAELLAAWSGRAAVDAAAYRLLREYRSLVAARVFEPVNVLLRAGSAAEPLDYRRFRRYEEPLLRLLEQRPPHLLSRRYRNWEELFDEALAVLLQAYQHRALATLDWGESNRLQMRHPLSGQLPTWLGRWLDMPATPLPGGVYVPRVQSESGGASQRLVVAPGREHEAVFHMPGGQSAHPLSPYYGAGHDDWVDGVPSPLLPGPERYRLRLSPSS